MSTTFGNKTVGPIGYGMLGLTWREPMITEEDAFATLRAAIANSCTLWDGGQIYGLPEANSLHLLNRYFAKYPEDASKVVLNIKGALKPGFAPDGSAEFVRKSVETCVKTLGSKGFIDQYELARRDPHTPLSETLGVLRGFVDEGKIGSIALSEVSASTIREAVRHAPIALIEIELSIWNPDPLDNGIVSTCGELGIPILAYSPIGRGFLSGKIKDLDDIPEKDIRHLFPRFEPENFVKNLEIVKEIEALAKRKGCTAAQLAINWVRCLSMRPGFPTIIPIPGAASPQHVEENAKIIDLTDDEMLEIDNMIESTEIHGNRYFDAIMQWIDG